MTLGPFVPVVTGHDTGYEPIWGISGTGKEEMLTKGGDTQIFYVDSGHANADDNNYGLDPDAPLATIQELMDRASGASAIVNPALQQYDTIYVSGNVTESVIIPETAPTHCAIIGAGASSHYPVWTAATAAGTALTVRAAAWTIASFTFEAGAEGTSILLQEVPASSYSAYKTTISNCRFDGLWGGLYGINFSGAPHRVTIEHCEFLEWRSAAGAAYAIIVSDTTNASPYEGHIRNCVFWENENHIGGLGGIRGFNVSTFSGNVFHIGELITATIMLDLRGGSRGNNIVYGNVFQGDYSNAGGYYAHAGDPGHWVGNMAEDLAEPEVGDNGWTIAPPAA